MNLIKIVFGCAIVGSTYLNADSLQQGMLKDLTFIGNTLQDFYVATEWKKETLGWDLESEIDNVKNIIITTPNIDVKTFHVLVKNLFMTPRDYHASVSFYSTEMASLPFRIKGSSGRYFFSYIDKEAVPRHFPFVEGDEILSFDGKPIHEVVTAFKNEEIGYNYAPTDYALAEISLTDRAGMLGHQVPQGEIRVSGCRPGIKREMSAVLEWDYVPEKIRPPKSVVKARSLKPMQKQPTQKQSTIRQSKFFKKESILPMYGSLRSLAKQCKRDADEWSPALAPRSSPFPAIGHVIWESEKEDLFHAYISMIPGGKVVGYLRVPTYSPWDPEEAAIEFAALVFAFEETTDVLVLDQTNNPGGYALYMYALASMLTDRPLIVPRDRMMLTYSDIANAHLNSLFFDLVESDADAVDILGETICGFPVTYQFVHSMLDYSQFIINEWNEGSRFTPFCHLYGIDAIQPHPYVNYTKPILVLIDQLDFSSADFFPAIMQDNQRAVLFGSRTAGAGGILQELEFPNLRGIASIRYTGSVAERSNGQVLENVGVTPDVPYNLSVRDLQNNYTDYIRAIVNALDAL